MSRLCTIFTSGFMLVAAGGVLTAQSAQRFSIQASALSAGVYGSAYDGMKTGFGGEAQFRYNPGVLSWGVGAQYTQHNLDDSSLNGETIDLAGLFVEPRYVVDVGSSRFAPYLSGRVAFLRQSMSVETGLYGTVSGSATGAQLNGGGGLLVSFTPRVNLDIGATFGYINFGDYTITSSATGESISGATGSGQNLILRVGLAIGLGK
jgi:hypothetical protein